MKKVYCKNCRFSYFIGGNCTKGKKHLYTSQIISPFRIKNDWNWHGTCVLYERKCWMFWIRDGR